jgi:hypothetical protein
MGVVTSTLCRDSLQRNPVGIIRRRQRRAILLGPGVYLITAIALLIGSIVLHNNVRFAERNLIFVAVQPFFLPVLVHTVLQSVHLALHASLQVSRERDKGTLEVLAYGPVSSFSYMLGMFVGYMEVYALSALGVCAWILAVCGTLNLAFTMESVLALVFSVGVASSVIALGLLLAVLGGRGRTSVLLFILIVVATLAIQAADSAVGLVTQSTNPTINDPILVIRNVLASLDRMLGWVAPFSQLGEMMTNLIDREIGACVLRALASVAETVATLAGAVFVLHRRGPRG